MTEEQKKTKHNYTSELELKSLLIRIKNDRSNLGSCDNNGKINKYIKWHTSINNKKYDPPQKRNLLKVKLKERIVQLSEVTKIDNKSYERFGEIVLLMIKNILKRPQFSGYTYKDDFYSDAVYKILKYLGNFNHELISKRTGSAVNAFAYISQIIHNSILFIINSKKKDLENRKKLIEIEALRQGVELNYDDWYSSHKLDQKPCEIIERVEFHEINGSLHEEILKLSSEIDKCSRMEIIYPKSYIITFDEYNKLKDCLKGKVSIIRGK